MKSYKSGGVLQVAVKIIQKSQSVKSVKDNDSPFMLPIYSEGSINKTSTFPNVMKSVHFNSLRASPGDFIEPYEDMTIPSTMDYVATTNHNPTKSMSDIISSPTLSLKPPRPKKSDNKGKRNASKPNIIKNK